ncbi:hypothetical protein DSL72_004762 [Monilinia vaccinii-corymbosi]|uniref:Zn(2)-C6 fungal-type domain-containing protein n=1 Tax=Monilinia vaccinii-corymbosi TaxID=61207 RepID=A0A8A3P1C6_9HELO|nr:hypothetical protein DSL72_004762 [Monilinia vaccinii-corymbosi]
MYGGSSSSLSDIKTKLDYESNATTDRDCPVPRKKSKNSRDAAAIKRRCVSTACVACRKRKSKCDGNTPSCAACSSVYGTECVYDPLSDHRRKGVYKEKIDSLKTRNSTLQTLIQAILNAAEDDVPNLVRKIRTCESLDDVADGILKEKQGLEDEDDDMDDSMAYAPTNLPIFESQLSGKMGELRLENGSVRFLGGTSNLIYLDPTDVDEENALESLMSVRECGQGRESKGWVYSGVAFRMAQDMGLNLDSGIHKNKPNNPKDNPIDEKENDVRRVTFWGCFLFDKCFSNYMGRLPQLPVDEITVPKYGVFPEEESSCWSLYTDNGISQLHSQPSRIRAVALQISVLCEVSSLILTFFYNPQYVERGIGRSQELRRLSEIQTRMEEWKRDLPKEFEPKEGSLPNVLLMHALGRKWAIDLPPEASAVLSRTDSRFGYFSTADVPSPRAELPVTKPSSASSPTNFQAPPHPQCLARSETHLQQSLYTYPTDSTIPPTNNMLNDIPSPPSVAGLQKIVPPQLDRSDPIANSYPPKTDGITTSNSLHIPPFSAYPPSHTMYTNPAQTVTPSIAIANPTSTSTDRPLIGGNRLLFGGVDQLVQSKNWWLRDQASMAVGFENWWDGGGGGGDHNHNHNHNFRADLGGGTGNPFSFYRDPNSNLADWQ